MIYIGIDPGSKGGIAVIFESGGVALYPIKSLLEVADDAEKCNVRCCLEQVHAMPKQGVSSTFSFGTSFGYIKGVLEAFRIPYQMISPNRWKREFSLIGKDKAASIECAKRLFPGISLIPDGCRKEQDGLAEALLMAEYARRHF